MPNTRAYTVAIVEDEDVLREELGFQLRHSGFDVETFPTAEKFYRYLAIGQHTVVLLDIGLSGEDGLSVCHYLRLHQVNIGIILVTARGLRSDRLAGLEAGADAYLVKPIDIDELVLTIKHLGERFNSLAETETAAASRRADDSRQWALDEAASLLIAPNRAMLTLSVNELLLLKRLFGRRGQLCLHTELGDALRLLPDEYNKHRVEVIISRLRERTERQCGLRLPVRAERNLGYRLVA